MDLRMSSRAHICDFSSATVCHKDFVWNVQYNKPETEQAAFVGAEIVWELRSRVSAQMGKCKGGLLCDTWEREEKTMDKNNGQHWLGADTADYTSIRIKQMMPLPIGTTVMAVDVDDDDNAVMRECREVSRPYCLVLTEDGRGRTEIYPFDLSYDGGIDVRGTVIPIRLCPKCRKEMQPSMEENDLGSLRYSCTCGHGENGWKEMGEAL